MLFCMQSMHIVIVYGSCDTTHEQDIDLGPCCNPMVMIGKVNQIIK